MSQLNIDDITKYVEEHIGEFHSRRIQSLDKLKLAKVLGKKNPYLFKAKHILSAEQLIKTFTDAHISSSEETIFGDWLEKLAIFINSKVYGGWKSGITGIDLEFDKDGKRYIVNIKSSPKWANSRQTPKMKADFNTAKITLRTSSSGLNVVAVNGCCYGKDGKPDKGEYYKFCGQKFWEFISGDPNLYTELIVPLGHKAKERDDDFQNTYAQMINKFTREFTNEFCLENGSIDWEKLVKFNSGIDKVKVTFQGK